MELEQIWTVAGILLGFQFTMIVWRVNREVDIEGKSYELYHSTKKKFLKQNILKSKQWLTPSDYLNIIGVIVIIVGVFIIPCHTLINNQSIPDVFDEETMKVIAQNDLMLVSKLNIKANNIALHGLVVGIIFFLGHIFSFIGHYKLYRPRLVRFSKKMKSNNSSDSEYKYEEKYQFFPFQEAFFFVLTWIIAISYLFYIYNYPMKKSHIKIESEDYKYGTSKEQDNFNFEIVNSLNDLLPYIKKNKRVFSVVQCESPSTYWMDYLCYEDYSERQVYVNSSNKLKSEKSIIIQELGTVNFTGTSYLFVTLTSNTITGKIKYYLWEPISKKAVKIHEVDKLVPGKYETSEIKIK